VTAPVDVRRVLAFALGAEHYAVPVTAVRAIAELRELTPVPCTPDYYVGVVNVRGKVISAIDLRLLFGIPVDAEQEGGQPPENIVVVEMAGLEISLLAHEVSGVTDLPAASLSLPSDALVGISPDYVAGTTAEGTILLDLETLLSDERMIVAEEVV
jgi:purine-binding chemotaxis protein CheW